jgi:GntR family transcriptional regulator/MocR family aminotransferase
MSPIDNSLGITLQIPGAEPLYRQLFDSIVARIRNGTFPGGYRLPPSRSLASALATHRNTVVRAYQELEAAGFIRSTVGRGTFVAEHRPQASRTSPQAGGAALASRPWNTLLSNAVRAEPLGRTDRMGSGVAPLDTINLGRMQPSSDLLPFELLRRCLDHGLRTYKGRALGYAAREGLPRLRELVAKDLARQGVPASAETLLITSGSQQALDLVARALINPGEPFLVDDATYHGALKLLSLAGARIVGLPSDAEGPDLLALERHSSLGA